MTIKEIRASDKTMLTPADVAPILGCNPYSLNLTAHNNIKALGFPASLVGTRLRIPRLAFISWYYGKEAKNGTPV